MELDLRWESTAREAWATRPQPNEPFRDFDWRVEASETLVEFAYEVSTAARKATSQWIACNFRGLDRWLNERQAEAFSAFHQQSGDCFETFPLPVQSPAVQSTAMLDSWRAISAMTFSGPLDRMLREALGFIQRNYLSETVIKHPDRAEAERVWNFPYAAVEEAVVNAVYHRSYEIREPVEVRITPAEFLVLSFPGPDPSVRVEDLRPGQAVSRRYRNRRIGEFLKELHLTEGRATGIPKMRRVLRENGSSPPEFETDENRLSFVVRLRVHPKAMGWADLQSTGQVTGEVAGQVTGEVRALLCVLRSGPKSRLEAQEALGLQSRTNFRNLYLLPGLESELVEMTLPEKPQSSKQRYRLTDKGQLACEDEATGQVAGQVQALLRALRNGEKSRSEAQESVGLQSRTNFRNLYLLPALEAGLIEMTIPDKPQSSSQKYRLTAKGRAQVAPGDPL